VFGKFGRNPEVAVVSVFWLQVPVAARSWKLESSPGHHFIINRRNSPIPSRNGAGIQNGETVAIELHHGDLPDDLDLGPVVAIDTETMGLNPHRDRLCLAQLSAGDGNAHLVKFSPGNFDAPNLARLLADPVVVKLFHFGRFDIAVMRRYLGVTSTPVYCTKIASKLVRTYTDRHGLKDLCRELIGVDISKEQQSSDWGAETLTEQQMAYAASDVLHLHALKNRLDEMLAREGRSALAQDCFDFLPTRAVLDLAGWPEVDIFAH
jgi:ribonuclease D